MIIYSKHIYTPNGILDGFIEIEDRKIKKVIEKNRANYIKYLNYENKHIIPGFIDNHIHGWATGSFWKDGTREYMIKMKRDLVKEGVTSFLGTTGTDTIERTKRVLKEAKKVLDSENDIDGANMYGIHLEGPFISKEYKGMQKGEYCLPPSIEILKEFMDVVGDDNIKLMTIAPELDGALEVIDFCTRNNIVTQVGHSSAKFEDVKKAIKYGLKGATHTYSGMRGFHHRELGVVGAIMYFDELYAEFAKQTGLTVKPEAFDIMFKLKGIDKMLLSTDDVALARGDEPFYHYIRKAKFIPEGDYIKIVHDDGKEEVLDRTKYENIKDLELGFFGSVKNILKRGVYSLAEISQMASYNPAKYMGIDDIKGSIEENKDADILILSDKYDLEICICRGKFYYI